MATVGDDRITKDVTIRFRVTADEKAEIELSAEAAGLKLSAYLRQLIFQARSDEVAEAADFKTP